MGKFFTAFIFAVSAAAFAAETGSGRFGVCAHLDIWEFDKYAEELDLVKDLGATWVRTGMSLAKTQPRKEQWNFSKWDAIFEKAERNGIAMLPILSLPQPNYDWPNVRPEMFAPYVEKCISRFDGKIFCWEVINEPNLEGVPPNEYVKYLSAANAAIKAKNPQNKTIHAGLSQVPIDYIEDEFMAGAGGKFDAMNVHPYQMKILPEARLRAELSDLRKTLRKNGSDAPVWITEIGNSSGDINPAIAKYFERALQRLGIDPATAQIAAIRDDKYFLYSGGVSRGVSRFLPNAKNVKFITADEIKNLSPEETPALLLCTMAEYFPRDAAEAAVGYIARGGTLISYGGNPFFRNWKLAPRGVPHSPQGDNFLLKNLRAGQHGKWADAELPVKAREFESAAGYEDIEMSGWFLTSVADFYPQGGDTFEPFAYIKSGGKKYPFGGIYKFRSDMKGNLIATFANQVDVSDENTQAKLLARTAILALSEGVEKFFVYCLRSSETDFTRESHFGLVRRNLEKKPAYFAYKTAIKMLGEKARPKVSEFDRLYLAEWTREDGIKVSALWTLRKPRTVKISPETPAPQMFDFLGNEVKNADLSALRVTDEPVYILSKISLE